MMHIFQYKKIDVPIFFGLIVLWLAAFKSASLFNFLGTYSSLWYLPAGITLSIVIAVPLRFVPAPLIANWLLAVPFVSSVLGVEYTSVSDHLLHGTRLFIIYGGAGLVLRFTFKIQFPVHNLPEQLKVIIVTLIASLLGAASGVSLHVVMGSFNWDVASDSVLPWMIGDGIAAIIVPPLLVPILISLFNSSEQKSYYFPTTNKLLMQVCTILIAMYVAFGLSEEYPSLQSLWFVVVLPPIVFAVRGGIPEAATAIGITALLTPPVAYLFGFEGERISLQFLLLISGFVCLMIGGAISDRNRAIAAIKLHEEELEALVAQRTDQLQKAYQFQKHLIRSIGHDVRQPLYALNHLLHGLEAGNPQEKLKVPLEQAVLMGQTALNITQRILDYAKREAGKVKPVKETFAIQSVFDKLDKMFAFERSSKNIKLNIQSTDLSLVSDEHLVLEAIANLIQNSIRLSKYGDVVQLSAEHIDSKITIIVNDQVTSDDDPSGEAGFGLEIVRQISKLLNIEFCFDLNTSKLQF